MRDKDAHLMMEALQKVNEAEQDTPSATAEVLRQVHKEIDEYMTTAVFTVGGEDLKWNVLAIIKQYLDDNPSALPPTPRGYDEPSNEPSNDPLQRVANLAIDKISDGALSNFSINDIIDVSIEDIESETGERQYDLNEPNTRDRIKNIMITALTKDRSHLMKGYER
jgi:hypothetical protein